MKNSTSLKVAYSPWAFFILFLVCDLGLVSGRLSLAADFGLFLFGILCPFIVALFLLKPETSAIEKNLFLKGEWFEVGPALWILLILLFVATRFYKLTTLPWPVDDDGYIAYYANQLAAWGDWRILYGSACVEPLFIWGLAGWFKLFQTSLWAIKTFPIFVFIGVLAAGYWGARQYFSKSVSFIATWFLALNFWTLFANRQCQAEGLLLLFECLGLYLLGKVLLSPAERQAPYFWLLAFCIGAGFYTYTPWPVVALMLAVPVLSRTQWRDIQSVKKTAGFILVPLLLVLPLIKARLAAGGTTYLHGLLGHPAGWDYLEALFWNGPWLNREYPSHFGWLSPCLGALFLVGFLELWKFRSLPAAKWGLWAFLLFLMPGMMTNFFEVYRMVAILPLVCLMAALGMRALFSKATLSNGKKITLFLLLAVFSLGLDIYHYDGPGQTQDWNFWISNKRHYDSVDYSRAYPLLETAYKSGSPLLMLTHLNNNNNNQTLNVASCSFDRADRTGSINPPARAALLINANFEAFLKKEFPDSEWTWLSPELDNDYGGYALGFIPVNPDNEKKLERWKKADEVFSRNDGIYMDTASFQNLAALNDLYAHYGLFQGDRFLESVFWAKAAFYEGLQFHGLETAGLLKRAIEKGYPCAQFYTQLGDIAAFYRNKTEAEKDFKKAMACPVNRTAAEEHLNNLKFL